MSGVLLYWGPLDSAIVVFVFVVFVCEVMAQRDIKDDLGGLG